MKNIYYYQPVAKPLAKNGSERLGVNAITKIFSDNSVVKMELSVFGKTTAESLSKLKESLKSDNVEAVELKCEYYLCTNSIVDKFKPFEVSKPFKDYVGDDETEYFIAWLNFEEVEKYYKENEAKIDDSGIEFWCRECIPGTMDVSNISMRQAKKIGLFLEIEEKLSLTVERNRAMTIYNLSQKYNCTPVQLIDKYL